MVRRLYRQGGVTLIELMIAILIAALLVLVTMPFTGAWIHSAQVHEGRGALVQAWGQAKAIALRNPEKVQQNTPAAELLINADNSITVCPSLCASTHVSRHWTIPLPAGVAVAFTDPAATAIRLNNIGEPLDTSGVLVSNRQITYQVSKGTEEDVGTLY